MKGVELVVLLATTLGHHGHHDLVRVRREDLVEPGTLGPFLETHVLRAGNRLELLYQRLAVRLDDVRPQPFAALSDHRERRAGGVHIQSDVPFHRRPPS